MCLECLRKLQGVVCLLKCFKLISYTFKIEYAILAQYYQISYFLEQIKYTYIKNLLKFDSGTLRLCDISTQKCIYAMDGHVGEVSKVSFSPQGNRILSGSTDKTARVWNVVSGLFLSLL